LCRRLVEAGVRLVTFTWLYQTPSGRISNVWDNHGGIGDLPDGKTGYGMLDADYCIPPLDRGLSALLEDLQERGLLDETLVLAMGEMGRTPRINNHQGRDHWGAAQSVLLAGGGVRGGQVYGATDAHAAYVKDNPVRPEDLLATVYHALGIDPDSEIHDRERKPYRITEGRPVTAVF
jgi:arylsulfatase A-like enzyme